MARFCDNCGKENRDVAKFCLVCGNNLQEGIIPLTGPLPPGTILDNRYTILKLIKAGGMGAVYKASYDNLNKICAIKELLPPYGDQEEHEKATEWFKRETKLLAKLDHPYLPGYVDCFICYGRYYLVMNFIEGEDLERKLDREGKPGLQERKVVEWARQILDVLDYLHTRKPPVIYRDIKPGNIMINKYEQATLIDFGIARIASKYSHTQKTAIGTNGYAPIEQCKGDAEPRSDLYALGATMHHLLTGVAPLPFRFEPVRKINSSISVEVERVIMKALKDLPDSRYASAKDMADALPYGRPLKTVTVNVIKPVTVELRKPGRKVWEFKTEGSITSSPCVSDGCVYFGSSDKKLYCLDAKYGKKNWEFDTGSYTFSSSPCVSKGFVYFGSGKNLYCIDGKTGKKVWTFETNLGFQSSPCVIQDSVYFGSNDKKLYCISAQSGEKLWEFETGNIIVSSPCVSKNFIYFGSDDYNLYCLEAKEGRKLWEFKTGGMVKSSPCVCLSLVYFGSNDKNIYCIDVKRGKKFWEFKTGFWVWSSPCVADDYVYIGSDDKKFYCIDTRYGKKMWDFQTGSRVGSSPCAAKGFVYFGSSDKKFYCLNNRTGIKAWEFETGGEIWSSPVIVNGFIYFGSNDKKLYCLDTGKSGLTAGNSLSGQEYNLYR